jgi:hypothetical protein
MVDEELDRFITRSIEGSEIGIPPSVQESLRRRTAAALPRFGGWKRAATWAPLLAAALLLVVFSLSVFFPPRPPEKKITQIRTEITIPDKNIKIIWVQRDDFHLSETNG